MWNRDFKIEEAQQLRSSASPSPSPPRRSLIRPTFDRTDRNLLSLHCPFFNSTGARLSRNFASSSSASQRMVEEVRIALLSRA